MEKIVLYLVFIFRESDLLLVFNTDYVFYRLAALSLNVLAELKSLICLDKKTSYKNSEILTDFGHGTSMFWLTLTLFC